MADPANPFAAPEAPLSRAPGAGPDLPTPLQRKALDQYARWHERPPTLGSLYRAAARNYVGLALYVAGGLYLVYASVVPAAGYFVLGLTLGVVLRDLGIYRRFLRLWPALDVVIDWSRVERLRGGPAPGVAGTDDATV